MADIEHEVKVLPIDENLQKELEKLTADGWQMVPGTRGMAIYHVVREKRAPGMASAGGVGTLQIDESKVFVLKPDGTIQ